MIRLFCRTPGLRQRCGIKATMGSMENHPSVVHGITSAIGKYQYRRRTFGGIPNMLLPPVVFGGLVIALWSWKCLMMVVFQNKIIYMPGLPPNARREKIEDYKNQCGGIQWREERTRAEDGTQISLCVASVICGPATASPIQTVYILYFQGNASSMPPRLPFLSPVLRSLRDRSTSSIQYTIVCCSYRGYWTSKGRPSEDGIAKDAAAAVKWIGGTHSENRHRHVRAAIPLVIWGQSIGAGVATSLAAKIHLFDSCSLLLKTLILETPFVSIRAMLETLYPQRWLPYRYLWPFLRNNLDSPSALEKLQIKCRSTRFPTPHILILEAGKDELVPKDHGDQLHQRCMKLGLLVEKKVIRNALHTDIMVRPEGRLAVVEAIEEAATRVQNIT